MHVTTQAKKMKSFTELIDKKRDLSHIIDKARWLNQVDTQIGKAITHLEPTLKTHCNVVKMTETDLTLAVDNNIWLTRLRYITPVLLNTLRQTTQFKHLEKIHWQIHLRAPTVQKTSKTAPKLSAQSSQTIKTLTESIQDPKLREALQRLASRTNVT